MGNVASRRRRRPPVVEERLTRPQRLVMQLPDMDAGRLRSLIRSGDLAPCFDGAEDADDGHVEECPICFYFYPSLNKSKCCSKGICTECFLQLMPSKTSHVVQYPICNNDLRTYNNLSGLPSRCNESCQRIKTDLQETFFQTQNSELPILHTCAVHSEKLLFG